MKYKLFSLLTAASLILGGCTDISDHRIVPETETTDTAEVINLIVPEHSVPAPEVIPEKREVSYRPADTDALHERLKDISTAREVTGMGIAVFRDGEIIYTDQLGYADRNLEKPVTRNTRFRAASVSKVISAALILGLCDKGMITPESVLDRATGLPFSSPYAGDVKLWHLLSHTSGITDTYLYERSATAKYTTEYILKNSVTGVKPGSSYIYSNFGAGTIGAVIEKLTGKFFHDYAEEALFEPLGMDAGYNIDLIDDKESCAVIYDFDGTEYNVPTWNRDREYYESFGLGNSYLEAQCELLITPSDLARLASALAGDGTVKECGGKRILSEDQIEKMHTVCINTDFFGMGLGVRRYDGNLVSGRTLYGHPGNALGAVCGMFYDRSDRTGVVIMTNHCNYAMSESNDLYRLIDDTVNAVYDCFFTYTDTSGEG